MLRALRREPGFYRRLWVLALPIVLQNIITTSLGFADTFMVGLLGNAEMAAVTAANVPIFIIQLVIFGLVPHDGAQASPEHCQSSGAAGLCFPSPAFCT